MGKADHIHGLLFHRYWNGNEVDVNSNKLSIKAESEPRKGSTFLITFPEKDEFFHVE